MQAADAVGLTSDSVAPQAPEKEPVEPVLVSRFRCDITATDLETLAPEGHLNSQVGRLVPWFCLKTPSHTH